MSDSAEVPDPVTAAQQLREFWQLGVDPIPQLVYEIEQHGILTVFISMKEDGAGDVKSGIDAFSTTALPRPTIFLTPDRADDVLRYRFSAASGWADGGATGKPSIRDEAAEDHGISGEMSTRQSLVSQHIAGVVRSAFGDQLGRALEISCGMGSRWSSRWQSSRGACASSHRAQC